MKHAIFLFAFLFSQQINWGQSGPQDSISTKKRVILSSSIIGLGYVSSLVALNGVWYKEFPKSNFHFFNDGANWMQMDKFGHGFSGYLLSQKAGDLYRWSGVKKSCPWIGVGIGMSYLGALEFMDAYSQGWGFSTYDVLANFSGGALYLSQELIFKEQLVLPKFSFFPSKYAAYRPEVLGSNFPEQLLKDYNGQTYWFSFPIGGFAPSVKKMNWLCLSLGYSVDQKLVGDQDAYLDFRAARQFLVSLDIDLTRLPIKNSTLKKVLAQLNMIKIPFSALMIQQGNLSFKPISF
ncbi:MAG: YfiM family protein [Crocinitomicaceae bacterium]|nr:YfiM family protein [Crocinitomicaceae bacterium]